MANPRTASRPTAARSGSSTRRRRPAAPKKRRPASSGRSRPAAGKRGRTTKGRRTARRGGRWKAGRWWPALIVAAVVLVGLAWDTGSTETPPAPAVSGVPGRCTVAGSAVVLGTDMAASAATIAAVGRSRGLPERAVVIALATAQQESRLRNLDYGDRDSLGLFQQRPSQGWGTEAQVQDPVYAAGIFYDRLVEVPGWDTGRLTEVAQAVQRSGFPEAYQQWEPMGEELAAALGSGESAGLDCRYEPPTGPVGADVAGSVTTELRAAAGPRPGGDVIVDPVAGWPGATWAVAHATRLGIVEIEFAGHRWTAAGGWGTAPEVTADALVLRPAG
jgi:hypothetical protein